MPLPNRGTPPGVDLPPRPPDTQSDTTSMGSHRARPPKPKPTTSERYQIRSDKKRQIQERCRSLQPPIWPETLQRLNAYNTALELPMPLNETAWEQLKHRLQAEALMLRTEDEFRNTVRTAPIPGQFRPPQTTDEYVLAHAGTPIKEILCEIAEEYIRQAYSFGSAVIYHTAPRFAADVLLHTKAQFVDLQARIRALRGANTISQESFFPIEIENLKLEHMRHIFVQSIKPRTEGLRKELFMCNDCPSDATRYFAFEAVVQHYSTQHTNAFQRGQAQVYWKSDWPDHPIFKPDPQCVDTPEPSVIHTSTLSHKPLTDFSQSSYKTAPPLLQDRRTPDTMSLMSNTTNTLSVAASLPAKGLYHVQREALAKEVLQAWTFVYQYQDIPVNLQLQLSLSMAVQAFNQGNKNGASIELFKDCLIHTDELAEVRMVARLRCGECVRKLGRYVVSPILLDLVDHFHLQHLSHHKETDKTRWYLDMVDLPNQQVIKTLLDDASFPARLLNLLRDAYINAVARAPLHETLPLTSSFNLNSQRASTNATAPPPERLLEYTHQKSMMPTSYIDSDTNSREEFTTRIRYVPMPDTEDVLRQNPGNIYADQYYLSARRAHVVANEIHAPQVYHSETMARSDTMRSKASTVKAVATPGSRREDVVDDFLSAIESHVDVEMASSHAPNPPSMRNARTISRASSIQESAKDGGGHDSTRGLPARSGAITSQTRSQMHTGTDTHKTEDSIAERRQTQQHIGHSAPSASQHDQRSMIESPPRHVIEFDRHGDPISPSDFTYCRSPPREYDSYQLQSEPYYRPRYDDQPQYTYRQIRHIPPDEQLQEVRTDEWGRTYIEQPAIRQYIELDTSFIDPRPEAIRRRTALSARARSGEASHHSTLTPRMK